MVFTLTLAWAQVKKEALIVGAQVDQAEVTVGEPLNFLITVMGPVQMNPKVNLTAFEGFEILSTGQSTQVQIRGVKVQSTLKLTYRLMPTVPGTHTLGPVKVEYQGKAYETKPVTVEVLPGPLEGAPKSETEPSGEPVLKGGVVL